jgi:hypothetical protein
MPIQVISASEKLWAPFAKQSEFIKIPFSVFEAMYGGAAGGGKSELLLMLPIIYGFYDIPRFHGILFRRTFPQLEESLILRSYDFYKPLGGIYDPQKHVWRFPAGARIRFSYLDHEDDARDHDTAEYHYAGFDELTGFTEFMYKYITSRVRSTVAGVPAIVRAATNPGNIGHAWVRDRFVIHAPEGGVILHDKETDSKRIFIQAKLTDNPHLMEKDPTYISRLRILPEAEQRAKIDGDWWIFSGMVFTEWRETRHKDEPQNALHVVDPFPIPDWWPKIHAVDWGYSAATWAGWAAVAPDSRVYLYREHVAIKQEIAVWGADVRRMMQYEIPNTVAYVLDPSAWQKRGEKTIEQQIADATGLRYEKAENDRIGGRMLMHEFLRWKPRPNRYVPQGGFDETAASRIFRMHGTAAYEDYCQLFEPEPPETNIPRLQVFRTCTAFRKAIGLCVFDTKDGHNTEDVAEWRGSDGQPGDDPYDGGRYLLKAVDRYLRVVQAEHKKRVEVGAIIQNLEASNDWNRYYRQMGALEARNPPAVGINRGRRRGVHFVAPS